MKHIFPFLLVFSLIYVAAGCGNAEPETATPAAGPSIESTEYQQQMMEGAADPAPADDAAPADAPAPADDAAAPADAPAPADDAAAPADAPAPADDAAAPADDAAPAKDAASAE